MEFRDEGSGTTTGQRGDSCLFYISSPFHPLVCPFPSEGPRYVALIPLLLYASLPLPYPSKTNLIPSWAGRETESRARWGGRQAQSREVGRNKYWWLLLRGHQEGNGNLLKFYTRITSSGFLPFHHITHTHTLDYGMCFPQSRNFCLIMLKGHDGH